MIPLPALSPEQCLQQLRNCTEKQAKHPQNHLEVNLWSVGKEWKGRGREKAVLWGNPETRAYAWDKRCVLEWMAYPKFLGIWDIGTVGLWRKLESLYYSACHLWVRMAVLQRVRAQGSKRSSQCLKRGLVVCPHVWISIYLYRESLYKNTLWMKFLTSIE